MSPPVVVSSTDVGEDADGSRREGGGGRDLGRRAPVVTPGAGRPLIVNGATRWAHRPDREREASRVAEGDRAGDRGPADHRAAQAQRDRARGDERARSLAAPAERDRDRSRRSC